MKVTFDIKPKSNQKTTLPYFAQYCGDIIVFVTALHKDGKCASGYMVNDNTCHKPFAYFTTDWWISDLEPITSGKLEIDFNE
jgi:hypothetical protein